MIEYNIDDLVSCCIRITMEEELTQEMYDEMFDPDAISYNMAKSILADPGDEAIGIGQLSEGFKEEIKYQILNNYDFEGCIYGENVEFYYDMQADLPEGLTLEILEDTYGLERMVEFLCDTDRTSALVQINEYFSCEFDECDIDIEVLTNSEDEISGYVYINNSDACIVNHNIDFTFNKEDKEFYFTPDSDAYQYMEDIEEELTEYLKDNLDIEIDEPSYDEEER